MISTALDFLIRGFTDRIIKAANTPALKNQIIAVLPYNDIIFHKGTDPVDIQWWKDPYLATAGLPINSDWLNLPKPSSYVAHPLRGDQYITTMKLEDDSFYNRRFFVGMINVYSSAGGTVFYQRRRKGLQQLLNDPAYTHSNVLNTSSGPVTTTDQTYKSRTLIWDGISALNVGVAPAFYGVEFDGFWILFKQ